MKWARPLERENLASCVALPSSLLTDDVQGEAGDQHRNRRASGSQDFIAAADR